MNDFENLPDLSSGEELLTNPDELIWRQVHPLRFQRGIISSEVFEPGGNDNRQLSCSRQSKVTAEDAHAYHTQNLGLKSVGSAPISVEEVGSDRPVSSNPPVAALRAIDDTAAATADDPRPPGHTYVDYRMLGSKRITKKAKQLAFFANQRGGVITSTATAEPPTEL